MNKEKCCKCDKMAVYFYAPSSEIIKDIFFCDDHVPRGCTCNYRCVNEDPLEKQDLPTKKDEPYKWIIKGICWTSIDDKGREFPCCEFWYDEEGY